MVIVIVIIIIIIIVIIVIIIIVIIIIIIISSSISIIISIIIIIIIITIIIIIIIIIMIIIIIIIIILQFIILRLVQNGLHLADDILKSFFWIFSLAVHISLDVVLEGLIHNRPSLSLLISPRWSGDKPLCKPIMIKFYNVIWRHRATLSSESTDLSQYVNTWMLRHHQVWYWRYESLQCNFHQHVLTSIMAWIIYYTPYFTWM